MQFTHLKLFKLYAAVALIAAPAVLAQGFAATCGSSGSEIVGTTFYATCTTDSGAQQSTSINLDNCVANYNGNLACATNGGYGGSCSGCEIVTGVQYMECYCTDDAGQQEASILDLDNCLSNYNGNLAC
ncbi:uncharacterized protein FIBRA_04571 [Fibroporia radiculosa]|uniref:Cyanovirin-N domain-containing protein n=1 Tax=Fibroporia radiculosa TaxID=599839 RepID=J4IA85_9APHY|nr:uncharacterized protein FIBRA_04571 [Fibroporia radiculosa]CCM02471.1 predicted protein [Fibroporia radiculosa]